jgi:NAD(P)-dependent dehydrogenase (short-subunit alcohol dehydrogenase family)
MWQINVKGSYALARAFLPRNKSGGTIIAYSSGFAFLPTVLPFIADNASYSTSKVATARFYEFFAMENPDLDVFILQPGVIRAALHEKGKMQLDETINTSKCLLSLSHKQETEIHRVPVQLPAHFSVWLASPEASPFVGHFLFASWDVQQLKSKVAPRLQYDPAFLTTSLNGFPRK